MRYNLSGICLAVLSAVILLTGCGEEELIEFPPAPDINYVEIYGQLQVSGGKLRDENGNAVQLKGMSSYALNWAAG